MHTRDHVGANFTHEVPRGLVRTQVAAHRKDGLEISFRGLLDLRLVAGDGAEMSCEVRPVLNIGQNVQ
jgi:hypothetical protein